MLAGANLSASDVAAIGITNQRETAVVWDRRTGEPIHHAIVWQDRRTAGMCDRLREAGLADLIRSRTGLVLDAYFSGTKVRWMLDNVEGAREQADRGELAFGTVDSWLIWNMTSGRVHVTDATNASRTLLYNIHTNEWDDELLDIFGVPRSLLPEVRSSSEVYAETSEHTFMPNVPIAGIAGDQQAALFGQVCTTPGMVKNNVRHRVLPVDADGRGGGAIEQQSPYDHCLADRRPDRVCAGGQRVHRRRRRTVAAGRAWHYPRFIGRGSPGAFRAR